MTGADQPGRWTGPSPPARKPLPDSAVGTAGSSSRSLRNVPAGQPPVPVPVPALAPAPAVLTGKQEHYLKRELLTQQVKREMAQLAAPEALQKFGLPFRSPHGEVGPHQSEFPLFRYVFVKHVRTFPFIDQANEKSFWQDKVQAFLEAFANKRISSSEDRFETSKRRKLAEKAEKVLALMMSSGLRTASGYEETINFAEIEVVDRGANSQGLVTNASDAAIHGWNVNLAGVRVESRRHHIRKHTHASYVVRVKTRAGLHHVLRTYAHFAQLRRDIQLEVPAAHIPPLPKKSTATQVFVDDDVLAPDGSLGSDTASLSSGYSRESDAGYGRSPHPATTPDRNRRASQFLGHLSVDTSAHKRNASRSSISSITSRSSKHSLPHLRRPSRVSSAGSSSRVVLQRETQRSSLRAFLRVLLQNVKLAGSRAMRAFLTKDPIEPTAEDELDIARRQRLDQIRLEEHRKSYESARRQAAELDRNMEHFRRDIVQSNALERLFQALKEKESIAELEPNHQTVAKWLRLEIAATLYHLFLAEDNSAELFAQAKQIHKYMPYQLLSTAIRFASPQTVMDSVVDLFLRRPLGTRSVFERIVEYALNGGMTTISNTLARIEAEVDDSELCARIRLFISADPEVQTPIRDAARDNNIDLLVAIAQSDEDSLGPPLSYDQMYNFNTAYEAWVQSSDESEPELSSKEDVELFSQLKQYYKLSVRLRDKTMMLSLIKDEPSTIPLFRELFRIFYNPLMLVYKTANVYNSIHDFSKFAEDTIRVVEEAQDYGLAVDPNKTVQTFIDLCEAHQDNFYKFVHEVYRSDNDLFTSLRVWLEQILNFLRHGPASGQLVDVNGFLQKASDEGQVDQAKVLDEVNSLIRWQLARKRWHQDKTKQKMAANPGSSPDEEPLPGRYRFAPEEGGEDEEEEEDGRTGSSGSTGSTGFESDGDDSFGFGDGDLSDLGSTEKGQGGHPIDPAEAERRRKRNRELLRRRAGEPEKPKVEELSKLLPGFVDLIRPVLA